VELALVQDDRENLAALQIYVTVSEPAARRP
jgi:hypothetical protein